MRFVLLAAAVACVSRGPSPAPTTADVLVVGKIHTLDPANPTVETVLLRDGKLACAGSRETCSRNAVAPKIVDLGGGSAIPGLTDAHGHIAGYGRTLLAVSGPRLPGEAEGVGRGGGRGRTAPKGRSIPGPGWG